MIPTRSAVCRNRKFFADRAIELSYAEGTNAASFNEIRKRRQLNEEGTPFNVRNADGGSFFGNCAANVCR